LGEADCISGLGDIARATEDTIEALSHYHTALALYDRIPEPYSIGYTRLRIARLTEGAERAAHLDAARAAWASIKRDDLIAQLDKEFGSPLTPEHFPLPRR
jgi:hypothetical protein